jgi:hypothetical protein
MAIVYCDRSFSTSALTFQEASAAILLPLLCEEQIHIQLPGIIFRPREMKPRVTCGNVVLWFKPIFTNQIVSRYVFYCTVCEVLDVFVLWQRDLL